ncbi:MAG TPA: hypothetical protein PLM75_11630 [bacterium]|nr:hypothetical protein [bacterium]
MILEEIIRTNNVIPIFKIQNMLTVGMVDPTDLYLIDELKQITGLNISPVLVSQSKLRGVISQLFGIEDSMTELVNALKSEITAEFEEEEYIDL